jgi:cysteine-rich repeat protein
MRRLQQCLLVLAVVAGFGAIAAHAEPIRLSAASTATLGNPPLEFLRDAVAQYQTTTNTATIFFSQGAFANSENVDAVHVLPNGHIILSTAADATIAHPPLTFHDGDLVEYDPVNDTATLFFSETHFAANADIDAVHVRPDGTIILSTDATATLGGLTFRDGDLALYNPTTDTATLLFSEDAFGTDENIDAVAELLNGHLVLSVARPTGAILGGLAFRDGDLVEYNPATDTATLYFSEDNFDNDENIDAVDLGCGNGLVEADEECDTGGQSPTCNANCTQAECGDGIVNGTAGETCDDGNLIDGDGCDANCTPTGCGNGVVTGIEECDDGGESATCDFNCSFAFCGDGTPNATAGETCDDANLVDGDGCDSNCTPTGCGNGIITAGEDCDDGGESATCDDDCTAAACGDGTLNQAAGEACDDGNTADGDCCSAGCGFESAGSLCPDDGDACTTASECDGAGTCLQLAVPASGCFAPAESAKAVLQIKDKIPDSKDRLTWKWVRGAVTTIADFGDPLGGDDYTLCLYDESAPSVLLRASAPAGGLCGSKPCWRATKLGFKYIDRELTPDGLQKVDLRAGDFPGKAKILVAAKGDDLPMPALPLPLPLRVQLHGANGQCWEARFSATGLKKNDGLTFKAKAD